MICTTRRANAPRSSADSVGDKLQVMQAGPLLVALQAGLGGWSRKKLKERLRAGCVTVNSVVATQHDLALSVGDEVVVLPLDMATAQRPRSKAVGRLQLVFRDKDYIAIDKPAGLLSVATGREQARTALNLVRQSLGPRARLWPVHRLDRETSGVLVFATSLQARSAMQAGWADAQKLYVAVVQGRVAVEEGLIETALWEDQDLFVHTGSRPPPQAKHALTRFVVHRRTRGRTVLHVRIETGRKHQIRVHLCSIGHPVVGDTKYGTHDRRMGLHAMHLSVTHPGTGDRLELHAEPPAEFNQLHYRQ